jgi:hypothetical protein
LFATQFENSTIDLVAQIGDVSGSQFAMLAAVAIVTTLTLIRARRRSREGGPSPRAYAREQLSRLRDEKAVHDDLTDVMTQLQQFVRETHAQLDVKILRLEKCIRDADERIGQLGAAGRGDTGRSRLDVTIADDGADDDGTADAVDVGGIEAVDGAEVGVAGPSCGEADKIARMVEMGQGVSDIARAMGKSVGEIRLILDVQASRRVSAAKSE